MLSSEGSDREEDDGSEEEIGDRPPEIFAAQDFEEVLNSLISEAPPDEDLSEFLQSSPFVRHATRELPDAMPDAMSDATSSRSSCSDENDGAEALLPNSRTSTMDMSPLQKNEVEESFESNQSFFDPIPAQPNSLFVDNHPEHRFVVDGSSNRSLFCQPEVSPTPLRRPPRTSTNPETVTIQVQHPSETLSPAQISRAKRVHSRHKDRQEKHRQQWAGHSVPYSCSEGDQTRTSQLSSTHSFIGRTPTKRVEMRRNLVYSPVHVDESTRSSSSSAGPRRKPRNVSNVTEYNAGDYRESTSFVLPDLQLLATLLSSQKDVSGTSAALPRCARVACLWRREVLRGLANRSTLPSMLVSPPSGVRRSEYSADRTSSPRDVGARDGTPRCLASPTSSGQQASMMELAEFFKAFSFGDGRAADLEAESNWVTQATSAPIAAEVMRSLITMDLPDAVDAFVEMEAEARDDIVIEELDAFLAIGEDECSSLQYTIENLGARIAAADPDFVSADRSRLLQISELHRTQSIRLMHTRSEAHASSQLRAGSLASGARLSGVEGVQGFLHARRFTKLQQATRRLSSNSAYGEISSSRAGSLYGSPRSSEHPPLLGDLYGSPRSRMITDSCEVSTPKSRVDLAF